MSEKEEAVILANKVLERGGSADPDDDLAILARQFLRAKELADRSTARLVEITEPGSIGAFAARDQERERCATIADQQALNMRSDAAIMACEKIAIDIRNGRKSIPSVNLSAANCT